MSGLSYQSIKEAKIIYPFCERTKHETLDLTYGCGPASYDVRLDQDTYLLSGYKTLASTLEHFNMPDNVRAVVHDKSSLIRAGISVHNTFIDPGWKGFLTLELSYEKLNPFKSEEEHHEKWREIYLGPPKIVPAILSEPKFEDDKGLTLKAGTPIAQIAFHWLDRKTAKPYEGHYQNQDRGAQPSKFKDE